MDRDAGAEFRDEIRRVDLLGAAGAGGDFERDQRTERREARTATSGELVREEVSRRATREGADDGLVRIRSLDEGATAMAPLDRLGQPDECAKGVLGRPVVRGQRQSVDIDRHCQHVADPPDEVALGTDRDARLRPGRTDLVAHDSPQVVDHDADARSEGPPRGGSALGALVGSGTASTARVGGRDRAPTRSAAPDHAAVRAPEGGCIPAARDEDEDLAGGGR